MNPSAELISEAIRLKKPIEFEYEKEGKPLGRRRANPHILFSGFTKEGIHRVWVHLVQTAGVSETLDAFPGWRSMIVEHMKGIEVLYHEPSFETFRDYNPASDVYDDTHVIARV